MLPCCAVDPIVAPSDGHLCALFEMLVERLGALETGMEALSAKLDETTAIKRLSFDVAERGTYFSTSEVLGCIDIGSLPKRVEKQFGACETVDVVAIDLCFDGIIYLCTPQWAAGAASIFEEDLLECFGSDELARIKRECSRLYVGHEDDYEYFLRSSDVGLESSYKMLNEMLLAIVAAKHVSGLVGFGLYASFFKVETTSRIGALEQAVKGAARLAELFKHKGNNPSLSVHALHPEAVELATRLACDDYEGVQRLWERMDDATKTLLKQDEQNEYSFFQGDFMLPSYRGWV